MAMADVALHSAGRPIALAEIAARQDISLSYLEQLFAKLRKSGLVKGVRGPRGGFLLDKPSDEIRILDIVKAIEEPERRRRRKNGFPVDMTAARGWDLTADLWHELDERVQEFLGSISLDDVVNQRVVGGSPVFADGASSFDRSSQS